MKKILSAVLVLGCIFAFASCALTATTEEEKPVVDNEGNVITIDTIQACIDDSAPKGANSSVTFVSDIGDLNGSYDVTYNDDGSATVDYSYELFNTITPGSSSDGFKKSYTGSFTVSADGVVSGDVGGIGAVEAVSFDIFLDIEKLSNCSLSSGILKAKVPAAYTLDVLGVIIDYDVDMNIITANGKVTSISMKYVTESGTVEISTTYRY